MQVLTVKQENQEMLDVVVPQRVREELMVMVVVVRPHVLQMGEQVFLQIIMYLYIVVTVLKEKL